LAHFALSSVVYVLGIPRITNLRVLNTLDSSTPAASTISKHQGTITVTSPGLTTVIMPAHMHISVHVLSSVGLLAKSTVGAPGTQGAVVTGMQGIGVSTPMAAAVAAATVGFAGDMHMPNDMTFTMGL